MGRKASTSVRTRRAVTTEIKWAVLSISDTFVVLEILAKDIPLKDALAIQEKHNAEFDRFKGVATVLPVDRLVNMLQSPGYTADEAETSIGHAMRQAITVHTERLCQAAKMVKSVSDIGLMAKSLQVVGECFDATEFHMGEAMDVTATKDRYEFLEAIGLHLIASE